MANKISIVVTVFNEEKTILELLSSLNNQSIRAYEIIVVDGGSTDDTWSILQKFTPPLKLRGGRGVILKIYQGKYNRSEGRNIGVSMAKGEIVAFTDAGCVPEFNWLKNITSPLTPLLTKERGTKGERSAECVSGYYRGLPQNIFEKCLVPYVLVMPDRVRSEFLPSTRSMAIRKDLFLKMGGFDVKLDTSEDFEFANRLKKSGIKFIFARDAVVGWYPRKNLKQAAWMFLKFAVSDIYAGIMRPKVKFLILRYYLFFFLVFLYLPLVTLSLCYFLWAIIKNYKYVQNWRAFYWLPVIQLTADCMVIFGTVMGLLSRPKK